MRVQSPNLSYHPFGALFLCIECIYCKRKMTFVQRRQKTNLSFTRRARDLVQQDKEIKKMKDEQVIVVYGVLACLRGLQESGIDGPVTQGIDRLEKHLNQQAHM